MIFPIELAAWLVFTVPLVGAVLTPLFAKINGQLRDAMAVLVGFMTAVLAIDMVFSMVLAPESHDYTLVTWVIAGSYTIDFGVLVDPLSVLLAVIAGGIGSLIILFSVGYMTGHDEQGNLVKDPSLTRYYFFMQMFVGGMTLLVMSDNLLMTFIGWEVVGMCSYALIGFWHNAKAPSPVPEYKTEGEYNSACGMKAFMVTRVGDIGLLAGIVLLFTITGTFNYTQLQHIAGDAAWAAGLSTLMIDLLPVVALLIFAGPIGKSAQFPLHTWLPEAMAGPTTVSALIHAAAMVKAGVFLVARMAPIFIDMVVNVVGLTVFFETVAWIGAFTAFMAATMALVQDEIKKVLAYSTISQLGYMFTALGASGLIAESVTAYSAGTFHLLAHALFKALLFLAAGAVLHAVESKSMRDMGGLWKDMKVTAGTFLVGALALAGVFPTIGFWSKEMIFDALLHGGQTGLFVMAFVTAILTAFYTFRMVFMTFFGKKSHHVIELESHGHHVHEAPWSMRIPLIILATLALCGGLFELVFFNTFAPVGEALAHPFEWSHIQLFALGPLTLLTVGIWIVGITPAYFIYYKGKGDFTNLRNGPLGRFLENRWYFNTIFNRIFVDGYLWLSNGLRTRVESALLSFSETTSKGLDSVSKGWRRTMTGVLNTNVLGMMIGIIAFLLVILFL
ncbi:MAG: NADH-quinone oxidoreductase subunit L [Candidatus Thorarchaeota archaeon]|nr:NADH-quinone oxidoreductase subunit L [Candidatus Thorarchaeota archaeon]